MGEPLTQDLASPLAERTRPQVSGPEDQHKDEGPEMGGDQAAKSKERDVSDSYLVLQGTRGWAQP